MWGMDIQYIYYYLRGRTMDYEKLWDELAAAAKVDVDYQRALNEMRKLETSYQEVCNTLPPEQKMVIEDYIAVCEELGDCMTWIAYRLGKRSCDSSSGA